MGFAKFEFYSSFTEFYWVLLGFTGFYWVLPSFTSFYWVLPSFTKFYWVLPGFTGLYWVALGFTKFYWVLLYRKPLSLMFLKRCSFSLFGPEDEREQKKWRRSVPFLRGSSNRPFPGS